MGRLAIDNYLWRLLYAERYVRSRSIAIGARCRKLAQSRLAGPFGPDTQGKAGFRSKVRDWKSQYRLRHNWSSGSCRYNEVTFPCHGLPRVLMRVQKDVAITADSGCGIRVWAIEGHCHRLLARTELIRDTPLEWNNHPTCLALDSLVPGAKVIRFAIGFADGTVRIYSYDALADEFAYRQSISTKSHKRITALDLNSDYVLSLDEISLLSLYGLSGPSCPSAKAAPYGYITLASLKSQLAGEATAITIRTTGNHVIATIAYGYSSYFIGWSVGLQEFRLSKQAPQGVSVQTRVATAQTKESSFLPLSSSGSIRGCKWYEDLSKPAAPKPISIAYAHPYLLTTHADNTLSLYVVHSTNLDLSISYECRLWGHTSTVSAAEVGDRGKAVTVAQGRDVRVWDLQEALQHRAWRRRGAGIVTSVRVQPGPGQPDINESSGTAFASPRVKGNLQGRRLLQFEDSGHRNRNGSRERASLAFDDEKLVVLRAEHQSLSIYDFT